TSTSSSLPVLRTTYVHVTVSSTATSTASAGVSAAAPLVVFSTVIAGVGTSTWAVSVASRSSPPTVEAVTVAVLTAVPTPKPIGQVQSIVVCSSGSRVPMSKAASQKKGIIGSTIVTS